MPKTKIRIIRSSRSYIGYGLENNELIISVGKDRDLIDAFQYANAEFKRRNYFRVLLGGAE